MELRYLRDTDRREVDFVVLQDGRAQFAVDCKAQGRQQSPHLRYFRDRTDIPVFYQVHLGSEDYQAARGIRVLPFTTFVRELGMP